MPTPENFNIPLEPITYESLLEKRRLESIQEHQLKEAKQFRENLTTKVTMTWLMHLMATFGLSYFTIFNNDFVNKGYEVRNYRDSEFNIHSACPKYGEMTNIKTNKCETPPIKNLATSMFYLNAYLMALSVAFSIILSEPVYGLYGEKSAKFRIKGAKERQGAAEILGKQTLDDIDNPLRDNKQLNLVEGLQRVKLKKRFVMPTAALVPLAGVYLYSCYLDVKNYDPGLTDKNIKESHYTIESIPYSFEENERLKDFHDTIKTYKVKYKNGKVENMEIKAYRNGKQNFLRIKDSTMIEMKCNEATIECEYITAEGKANSIQKVTINPKDQARIIPCPGADVEEAINLAHQSKLEIVALIGTGTTTQVQELYPETLKLAKKTPKKYPFIRYSEEKSVIAKKSLYYQPAGEVFVRLRNGKEVYTDYPSTLLRDGRINPVVRTVGYVTYFDNQRGMELLDFTLDTFKERNSKIQALKDDPKVQGFSLTAWSSKFTKDKMYYDTSFQPRTVYVFNQKTRKFLGSLFIPKIKFKDIQSKIEEIYPDQNAIGAIQDGDKFAGMVDLTKITSQNLESEHLMERSNLYTFQAVHCLAVAKDKPKLNTLNPKLKQEVIELAKKREFEDKIADISKQINGKLGIQNPLRWVKSNQKIAK